MKLKTSFFDPTVLKKDITRFAPVWGLYTVFTLLFLLLMWESEREAARFVNNAPELFLAMGMVNFFYAPLVALCLFSDLFKSRMCNALHALPLRREGWFLTHVTAGMLFCLVPNGLAALICAALLGEYAWVAFLWLALMVMQYLFFFGVATFGCLCAGNGLGAIAICALVNFLAVLISWLAITFYQPMLYGIRFSFENMADYSPIIHFSGANYLEFHYDNMKEVAVFDGFLGADWRYVGISAGIGAALLVLSLLIYRIRHLESAGDLISFKPAAPVVLALYTLCVGAVLYYMAFSVPFLQYLFLTIGIAIGFFTGRMLLERRVKVFRKKNLLAFVAVVAAFYASLGITALDPMGVARYVPEKEQIATTKICASHYFYDINQSGMELTKPEDIDRVLEVHRDCIDHPVSENHDALPLYIRHELKNGTAVERYYYVSPDSEYGRYLQSSFSSVESVFRGIDPTYILDNLQYMECYSYDLDHPLIAVSSDPDAMDIDYYTDKYGNTGLCIAYALEGKGSDDPLLAGLFDAIVKDCEAGHMAQPWQFSQARNSVASITLQYRDDTRNQHLDLQIYEDCEHTVAYLKTLQTK